MQFFQINEPGTQRNIQKKCMICSKQFTFTRKEHQCKRCFRAVCADCGKDKNMVFKPGFKQQPHRNCKLCVQETKCLRQYISSNKLVFGRMSTVGEKWVKKLQKCQLIAVREHKKDRSLSREQFNRMWDSYNFSMRQLIGLLTFSSSQQDVFSLVVTVINNFQNAFPSQSTQTLAYLSIFLLCFCSPDSATALGILLLQLKNTVADSEGLLLAYLKALGMGQQDKIRSYAKYIGAKFVQNFSINISHVNSSIYLVQKVINRRKIEEVFMFLSLSLDVVKDAILKDKIQLKHVNLLLVRNCTPNSTSAKYRQASSLKTSFFIKEATTNKRIGNYTREHDLSRVDKKQHNLSYNQESFYQAEPQFNKKNTQVTRFQNKFMSLNEAQSKVQSPDDSFSTTNVIQQLKQPQKPNPEAFDGSRLLFYPNRVNYKQNQQFPSKLFKVFSQNSSVQPPLSLHRSELTAPNQCSNCQQLRYEAELLKRQIQQYIKFADLVASLKEENQQLRQILKRLEKDVTQSRMSPARQNLLAMEKGELEAQLRKLKQTLAEFQNKQKDYQISAIRLQQAKKINKRLQAEVRCLQTQNQDFNSTIKMLNNKLQSYALQSMGTQRQGSLRKSQSTDVSISQIKIKDLLKQSVKQKNNQIEQLTKKNRLMAYQIQEASRLGGEGRQQVAVQEMLKLQSEREGFMRKMRDISERLLQEECEKFKLSEDNFILKQILRENKIIFQ